jgi:hypothetical protein
MEIRRIEFFRYGQPAWDDSALPQPTLLGTAGVKNDRLPLIEKSRRVYPAYT